MTGNSGMAGERSETMDLATWNNTALSLVQAMLGAVSPNFRMVYLGHSEGRWNLGFVLAEDDETDREEIEDIAFEFEALQDSAVEYDVTVRVASGPLDWPDPPTRVLFKRRED